MTDSTHDWQDLFELLGPIHDDVQLFARRIARSNAEGDDVFQEAVLRAAQKLSSLRDRARFRAWMHSIVVSVHRTVLDVVIDRVKDEIDDAGLEAALTGALSDGGFRDVVVHAAPHEITVTIKSPPR